MAEILIKEYYIQEEQVNIPIKIIMRNNDFTKTYLLELPEFGEGTKALIESIKHSIIMDSGVSAEKMLDPKSVYEIRAKFLSSAKKMLKEELPKINEKDREMIALILLNDMFGLGKIDFLLLDGNLEEIVANNAQEPAWVYHKEFGWLKTNIFFSSEEQLQNYANIIARRGGKQITTLNPLLDTHLVSGDRANATLFPISGKGNTITIRRFRRDPWTVTDFIKNKTATSEVMALVWLCIQYELNMILSGGTASGKTSFMNVCLPFIQPNHRVITIEDTRELMLPEFLHWVPMTTREPNAEGKGEVNMLDLLVNSLRQRP
ncbi:MAG: type II/IV secretion system ATPase subunit, partial [Candidatus Diapherotrites archaeon]